MLLEFRRVPELNASSADVRYKIKFEIYKNVKLGISTVSKQFADLFTSNTAGFCNYEQYSIHTINRKTKTKLKWYKK